MVTDNTSPVLYSKELNKKKRKPLNIIGQYQWGGGGYLLECEIYYIFKNSAANDFWIYMLVTKLS